MVAIVDPETQVFNGKNTLSGNHYTEARFIRLPAKLSLCSPAKTFIPHPFPPLSTPSLRLVRPLVNLSNIPIGLTSTGEVLFAGGQLLVPLEPHSELDDGDDFPPTASCAVFLLRRAPCARNHLPSFSMEEFL